MWRHELDMVSSLASESALAALVDMEKLILSDAGMLDPKFHSGLSYSSDMLRVAGFVAPTVFAREIARTFSQLVLGKQEADILRRALSLLISYLKDALTAGARPTLFFYEEVLLLSNVSGHLPVPCGSLFAPFAFWDAEDHLIKNIRDAGFSRARDVYQHALLAYLREKDVAHLAKFPDMFEQAAASCERCCGYSIFRLLAAFFAAVTNKDTFLNQEEMQLFSMIDAFFFKQTTTLRYPDPLLISRLLHVIGKATVDSVLVRETQSYFDLDGLLSGSGPEEYEFIRA